MGARNIYKLTNPLTGDTLYFETENDAMLYAANNRFNNVTIEPITLFGHDTDADRYEYRFEVNGYVDFVIDANGEFVGSAVSNIEYRYSNSNMEYKPVLIGQYQCINGNTQYRFYVVMYTDITTDPYIVGSLVLKKIAFGELKALLHKEEHDD